MWPWDSTSLFLARAREQQNHRNDHKISLFFLKNKYFVSLQKKEECWIYFRFENWCASIVSWHVWRRSPPCDSTEHCEMYWCAATVFQMETSVSPTCVFTAPVWISTKATSAAVTTDTRADIAINVSLTPTTVIVIFTANKLLKSQNTFTSE